MKPACLFALTLVASAALASSAGTSHAQEGIDKAKAAAFDNRMFAGPLREKTYACFVRHYDASHLAQHPRQKVSAMKLLVTAENPPEEKTTNYSFRIGVQYRHRPGKFDSSGFCNHVLAEDKGNDIRYGCGVDCERGGINVALKDDKSASSASSASSCGSATSRTKMPAMPCWPAPTTRYSGSIAPICVNAPNS